MKSTNERWKDNKVYPAGGGFTYLSGMVFKELRERKPTT